MAMIFGGRSPRRLLVATALTFTTAVSGYAGYLMTHPDVAPPPMLASGKTIAADLGGSAIDSFAVQAVVDKALERKPQAQLRVDPELFAAMQDTPGNRALVATNAENMMQAIGTTLGIPENKRPHYKDLLNSMAKSWQDDKMPEDRVATLLRAERAKRDADKKAGVKDEEGFDSVASMALAPYLMDAGMCSGDIWSETGSICTYIDREPGGPHVTGSVRKGGSTDTPTAMREVPADSALSRILAAARNPQNPMPSATPTLQSTTVDSNSLTVSLKGHSFLDQIIDVVAPRAHAAEDLDSTDSSVAGPTEGATVPPTTGPVSPTTNLPVATGVPSTSSVFDVQSCTVQIPTQATTQVVRLDPYALGLLIFEETVGKIKDPGATWDQYLSTTLTATIVHNAVDQAQKAASQSVSNQSNRAIDRDARNACRNYTAGQAFNDCYAKAYKGEEYNTVAANYGLSLLSSYIEQYALDTVLPTSNPYSSYSPLLPFAVKTLLTATAQVNVYGEAYVLTTVQYAATDADQVFVVYPFGFACATDECTSVGQCALVSDDPISCMQTIARVKNWDLRPQGAYIEHSINSCVVQAVPYAKRLPYQALRANETATGSTGLPHNITFRSSYQLLAAYPEPNRCDPTQTGNPLNTAAATLGQTLEHTCPFPTAKIGPTDPTPPLGAITPSTSGGTGPIIYGATSTGRVAEQIPTWRWYLGDTTSNMVDYTAIYAGLTSTQTAYNAARNPPKGPASSIATPGQNLIGPPDCAATHTFNGVQSGPGQSFWAFHGASNQSPAVSQEMQTGAGVGASLNFYELVVNPKGDSYAAGRFSGYVASAQSIATSVNGNQAYDCSKYPISTSILCSGGGQGLYVSASRTIHPMPEVNIILADQINHDPVLCNTAQSTVPAQFYVYGSSVPRAPSGQNSAVPFVIERSGSLASAATVDYATQAGTGKADDAIAGSDYRSTSGRAVFPAGVDHINVNVLAYGSSDTSGVAKRVYFAISNPMGAQMPGNTVATGSITNGDGGP